MSPLINSGSEEGKRAEMLCLLLQQTILLRNGERLERKSRDTRRERTAASFGSNPAVCEFADEKDLVPAQVIAVVVRSQAEDEGERIRA